MDTNALHAQLDSLLHQTTRDAYQHNAKTETLLSEMLETATDANNAQQAPSQMHCKEDVIELSQNAHALKSMIQVDTFALNAHHTKLLPITIVNALQLPAQTHYKFLDNHQLAINAEIAPMDLNQITSEEDVWDSLLHHAHAERSLHKMDTDVNFAQLVLDHPLITEHASPLIAKRIKSSDLIWNAHNVNGAQQDLFQTLLEPHVLCNQDQQSMLEVFQAALNIKFSTLLELTASHAQITL